MRIDLCDATDSFRTTLSEDHLGSHVEELRTLDEAEPARGLVTSSEVFSVHCEDGGCLTCATTVNWTREQQKMKDISHE